MSAEARFREVESLLDQKLSEVRGNLISSGVAMYDLSARTYHYKNQFLSWSWKLVRETIADGETERFSVFLTYMEPLPDRDGLDVLVRSEVFHQGQISRIDCKLEYRLPVSQVEKDGVETIIAEAFERGRSQLLARVD